MRVIEPGKVVDGTRACSDDRPLNPNNDIILVMVNGD